ncbi:hypothetical protein GWI33_021456 [Rhynchophorus ferrugineus]|uniref:Golgin subfamily A conserved domain-containing protein n=1 Tax=Rhynchophorus ferrugineus TaxID=354439 RepID=A0A834IPK7_RHYFE|nr:hypothetical protein GWI33_021456 [Rhynchophorus ferrugineus]
MADAAKEQKLKLANSRKRFKELQELKRKREECQSVKVASSAETNVTENKELIFKSSLIENSELSTPKDNLSLNIDSNESSKIVESDNDLTKTINDELISAHAADYFDTTNYPSTSGFFENYTPEKETETDSNNPSLLSYFSDPKECNDNVENIGKAKYFDNSRHNSHVWDSFTPTQGQQDYELFPQETETGAYSNERNDPKTEDAVSLDDPEIKQNEISEMIRKSIENLVFDSEPTSQYYQNRLEKCFSPSYTEKLADYLGAPANNENTDININQEIDNSTNLTKKEIQHSNVESLRQLSDQLAQMIEPSYEYSSSSSITDLEKRNIELAACLEKEKINSEQLRVMNIELQNRISNLETQLVQNQSDINMQGAQEIGKLKSDLQTHLQTIGLLVAEKTELSSSLTQYELSHKQKNSECEDLQGRLKASRARVAELEKELHNLKVEKNKVDNTEEQYIATLESFKKEYKALKDQKDELAQDVLEVREKLKCISDKNIELQQENKELTGKLSLADIKIQQLTSLGSLNVDSQIDKLTQEKFALENEITNLNQMLKSVLKEHDESSTQYQHYAHELNAQLTNLSNKLEQLQQEKDTLLLQEQNRIKHIGELERQLQNLQNERVSYSTTSNTNELRQELEKTREMCVQLQVEKVSSEENYTKVSNEKELLLKELQAKTDSISQLECMVEQLRGNQPDSVKLLAAMESDKVAASRAIQQNKELKQKLESMHEVFKKMDDDKVELTENLNAQQQTNRDLLEKLQKTELSLQSLANAIEIKDQELTHLRESTVEMSRQTMQQEQLEDRLRHYEAHDNSAHILQHELQKSQDKITQLTSDLNELIIKERTRNTNEQKLHQELQDAKQKIIHLNNDVNMLRMNGDKDVSKGFTEEESLPKPLQEKEDCDNNKNILDKENAMKCLEEKVKKTMQEIADLTEEKQRLEHIVLQLQSETETIGEYVALYQHQRMVLKQKTLEKDHQLKQLETDREHVKNKLDRLNQLIKKLIVEKGTVPTELLEHQESMKDHVDNLCEEHTLINNEINKIAQTQINTSTNQDTTNQTADEIISLLSEIKSSNLVQPDSFHHCPWCSGQLITV